MCERAIFLRREVTELLNTEPELVNDYLTSTNWGHLINIMDFLGLFRVAIKTNEGILDVINRVLPGLEYLIMYLEEARLTWANNKYILM